MLDSAFSNYTFRPTSNQDCPGSTASLGVWPHLAIDSQESPPPQRCGSETMKCGSETLRCGSETKKCGSETLRCGSETKKCGYETQSCGRETRDVAVKLKMWE